MGGTVDCWGPDLTALHTRDTQRRTARSAALISGRELWQKKRQQSTRTESARMPIRSWFPNMVMAMISGEHCNNLFSPQTRVAEHYG